jgi:hypothetical protein
VGVRLLPECVVRSSGLSVNPTRERAGERRVAIQQAQKTASLVRDNLSPGVVDPAGNTSGTLSGSSTVAVLDGGKILSATLTEIGAVIGGGGGGGGGVYWLEVDLGSTPSTGGSFEITILTPATVGSMVVVSELPRTLSNSDAGDRASADPVTYAGIVTETEKAVVYWSCPWLVMGLRAIAYEVRELL